MKKYIHKDDSLENSDHFGEQRTIYFDKTMQNASLAQIEHKAEDSNTKRQILLDVFIDPKIHDEKLESIKNNIESVEREHHEINKRINSKSKNLEKQRESIAEKEQEIEKLIEEKSQEFDKDRKFTIIGEYSSKMAHDIRNPLSIIRNQVFLIRQKYSKQDDEIFLQSLEKMDNAAMRISQQLDDVMDFLRDTPLQIRIFDVFELLKTSINDLNIPSSVDFQCLPASCKIKCDKEKTVSVFSNVIKNALQAIDNSGKITVRIEQDDTYCIVEIEDSGPGISDENMDKIFDPLFTTKNGGTGLGLAMCRQILESQKGSISVKTKPTTFIIKLPKYL